MNQFQKFISILALVLLPISVMASTGGGLVEIEIHSFPSQGGMVKVPSPHIQCMYCTLTQELLIAVEDSRGNATVTVTELTGSGEVFSTSDRVPMFCSFPLTCPGIYRILISLSSGQRFMGMLTVESCYRLDSPAFQTCYEDAGSL